MKALFSPFHLKRLLLPNRIVMPGLASFLFGCDGGISAATVEHYRRRAAGGAGMVIMEACAVSPEGVVSAHQARIYDDRFIAGLARIASAIKSEGAVPAVQIHHGGRQTSAKVIGRRPLAPSPLPCPNIRGEVEPLTVAGIRELVQLFGRAAERACQAGFELIEVHGAHGYLVNQFLSRFSNIRNDEYGGDVAGRTRFAREIVEEIRRRVGADLPLSFKISAEEYVADGLTTEESLAVLPVLVRAGIDVVQVSAGNDVTPEWICQPMFMPKACLADSAARIKKALTIPVMAVGRINDPFVADQVIAAQQADLVCIGRGLLADPEMPRKAREGRFDEIRTCLACNSCMESIFKRGRIECLVNPTLGREQELVSSPAARRKRVMVVGGGPAGLNLAGVAAERGHEVHVFEKKGELGGQLLSGSVPRHKEELRNLIRFQQRQAERFGVCIHLRHEVSAADVEALNPDVVVLATGSLPAVPAVPGIEKRIVAAFDQVLNGHPPDFKRAVVVGGGPTGLELALHLAEGGCAVTVLEMLPEVGRGMEAITRKVLLQRLRMQGVVVLKETELKRIEDNGVVAAAADQRERFIEADKVVLAIGTRPDTRLYEQIQSLGLDLHRIGDCWEPRNAMAAIYESAALARKL
jgi:2,4-dienoyl-CoA reductase-like NADH-dependent reductase (Old Yellow Enzyme family)/thioredoxin reductase